jgi:hypothetical protein
MNKLNSHQEKFLELVDRIEKGRKLLKELGKELAEEMRQIPLGEMFQNPKDGVVYQVIAPSGTYVEFKNIDYIRTRKEGEKAGTLSITAAKEAGFSLSIPGEVKNETSHT